MNPVQWGLPSTANIGRLMVTAARRYGTELPFGRDDAVDQARVLQALITSAEVAAPVRLT